MNATPEPAGTGSSGEAGTRQRLIIHGGIHRTGTTAVQAAFSRNSSQLRDHGILYPKYYGAPDATNHTRLAWDVHSGTVDLPALHSWADSLARTRSRIVVLSAEDFSILRNLDFLDCFLGLFDVEVVFYVRRQDDWVNSWYNQHVKWPFDPRLSRATPLQFLDYLDDFHWIRYFDLVERWAARIGRERVRVRVLESGQISNPVADMLDLCGVDFELDVASEKRVNESLPVEQVELVRRIGTYDYPDDVRNRILVAVRALPDSGITNVYPAAIRRLILAKYTMQNQRLAERYLGRSDRVLFSNVDMPETAVDPGIAVTDVAYVGFIRNLIDVYEGREPG